MEIDEKTQDRTTQVRRTQVSDYSNKVKTKQPGRIEASSGSSWNKCVRPCGSDRRGRDPFGSIGGEIINRLILQAEKKLKDAKDSIEWYQQQSKKLEIELEDLKNLKSDHSRATEELKYTQDEDIE